jgi:hypothetical protein
MTTTAPTWTDSLTDALKALESKGPKNLLSLIAVLADYPVSEVDVAAYLAVADENDGAFVKLRIVLAAWDASDSLALLGADGTPTPPQTKERRLAIYGALGLGADTRALLDTRMPTVPRGPTVVISKTFEPWYRTARLARSCVYWEDYRTYLERKHWNAEAIGNLDVSTSQVVERLADPTRETAKRTKGLVVGYVQSGKTANFTGVSAKAIDAGYRLVIVLTGTIEILRAQTQRRLDMELVGKENLLKGQDPNDPEVAKEQDYLQDPDWIAGKFVSHGTALGQPGVVNIERVTTRSKDYQRLPQGLTRLKFHKFDKSKPLNHPDNLFRTDAYVAVVKKEKNTLEKLIRDLKPIKGGLADLPVLIIDDEADVASPDTTNPKSLTVTSGDGKKRTTINRLITQIMDLCPRAQYVGYTATPFANVFINPDDDLDLFPSDFVLSLKRPPGYMGVQEFHDVGADFGGSTRTFGNSNELAHVRSLVGDPETDPLQREVELRQAVDAWVLSGAIKKYREAADSKGKLTFLHHTLLVHESTRKADHSEAANAVRAAWWQGKHASSAGRVRLRKLFYEDFLPVMLARAEGHPIPATFEDVEPYIAAAVAAMTVDGDPVLVVNSDKELQAQQKKLDFDADPVWRILVGGTQLSRGFTVEGLTISYYRRKAGQADTLMQAGRWFGFRPGYRDLVRLYIRRDEKVDLYDAFEALLMDEEALREELERYQGMDESGRPLVEPRQIPPLVSQHLPWLKPTARNKMYNAVVESKGTAGGFQDRYGIPDVGSPANQRNLDHVGVPLLLATSDTVEKYDYDIDGNRGIVQARVGVVSAPEFRDLFAAYEWHPEYREIIQPLTNFLTTATDDGRIEDWAVFWPQPLNGQMVEVPGLGASPVVRRKKRSKARIDYSGSTREHREVAHAIVRSETLSGIGSGAKRGAVLIYLVDPRPQVAGTELPAPTAADIVPLLSIAIPSSATPRRRDLIQWTVRSSEDPMAIVV